MMIVPLIFIVIVCTCLFNGFVHGQAYCNDLRLFIEGFYFNELEKKMISYVKAYRKETKLNSSIRKTLKKITLQENTQTINCTQKNIKELL
jgi:hydrogenase/urease accessory protein HupE